MFRRGALFLLPIQSRVHVIYVFLIQPFPKKLAGLTETLEMNDLPLPQELDHVVHIRVVGQPENVVVGDPGLLLGGQVLHQIRHGAPLTAMDAAVQGKPEAAVG